MPRELSLQLPTMSFFEPFTGRVKHPGTSSKVTLVHPAAQILSASECKAPWVHLLVNGYNFRKSEVILPNKMKIIAVQCGTPNGETLYIQLFQSNLCFFSISITSGSSHLVKAINLTEYYSFGSDLQVRHRSPKDLETYPDHDASKGLPNIFSLQRWLESCLVDLVPLLARSSWSPKTHLPPHWQIINPHFLWGGVWILSIVIIINNPQ